MLRVYLLLLLGLLEVVGMRMIVGRFTGFVGLDQDGKEFDQTEKPLHTSRVWILNLGHKCGRDCVMCDIVVFLMLMVRGGDTISMMEIMFLLQNRTGVG